MTYGPKTPLTGGMCKLILCCYHIQLNSLVFLTQISELSTVANKRKKKKTVVNDDEEPVDLHQRLADQRALNGYQTIKERAEEGERRHQEIDIGQRNIRREAARQREEQLAEQKQAERRGSCHHPSSSRASRSP
jgi:hypothetical protein